MLWIPGLIILTLLSEASHKWVSYVLLKLYGLSIHKSIVKKFKFVIGAQNALSLNMRSIVITVFILSVHINCQAQFSGMRYPMQCFQESQGYPAPIKIITKDRLGFLWMGTTDGIFRFDGQTFRAFKSRLNDKSSIPNNFVNDIKVDASNRIWVATNGGLAFFDYSNDYFQQIQLPDTLEKVDKYRVHALYFDLESHLWFLTAKGAHQLDKEFHIIQSVYPVLEEFEFLRVVQFMNQNEMLFGTNNSRIVHLDLCSKEFHEKAVHSQYSRLMHTSTSVGYFSKTNENQLIIGSWMGGLNLLYKDTNQYVLRHFDNTFDRDIKANIVTSVVQVNASCWWVGTFGAGIHLFNPQKGVFYQKVCYDPLNPYSLSSDYVLSMYRDPTGIIWIGTQEGLNKYDPNSHQFQTAMIPQFDMENSVYRRPYCLLENRFDPSKKSILIAVPGIGLLTFNPQNGQFAKFGDQKFLSGMKSNDWIYSILYDHKNRLIALTGNGIYEYRERTHRFYALQLPGSMKLANAHKFIQDRKGNFWILTSGEGMYFLSDDFKTYRHFSFNPREDSAGIQDNFLFCILEDQAGKIWVGSQNNGISIFDPESQVFQYIRHNRSNPQSLPDNSVFDIEEDPDGQVWVATENGLARFDKKDHRIKVFTDAEGLPNSNIASLLLDKESKIWLATNSGLAVLNRKDGSFHNFGQLDGLASNRMRSASYMSPDGTVFFSTTSAISWCDNKHLFVNAIPPEVYITGLKVYNGTQAVQRSGNQLQAVSMSYTRNLLEVEFAALNYSGSEKNKYAYYLEGYDKEWNYSLHRGLAAYANLPGGEYVLKLKASNNDGLWNMSKDVLRITVTPPFWQQSRFYLLIILAVIASIYFYFKSRLTQLKHIQDLRMAIARDLHDEVGSTLSSIYLTTNLHMNHPSEREKLTLAMGRIQTAAKSAMDMMNEIVWSLKPENDQLGPIVHRMRSIASEMLEPAGILFDFNVYLPGADLKVPLDKRKELILYFKEALNNMAKYSNSRSAMIEIRLNGKVLHLLIRDFGAGFDPQSVRRGNGLQHLGERAHRMNGTHYLYSELGSGTEIRLELKLIP